MTRLSNNTSKTHCSTLHAGHKFSVGNAPIRVRDAYFLNLIKLR